MLFFGTGRPFTMEDESWTKGIFPPFPSTIYGFLRSVFFENNMEEFPLATTGNDPTRKIKILSYSINLKKENKEENLYPIPFGHVKSGEKIERLKLKKNKIISNYEFDYFLTTESKGKKETLNKEYYVTKEQLSKYLNKGEIEEVIHLDEYITKEARIGISRDHTLRNVEEGKLYRIEFNQLNNSVEKTQISFNIEIETTAEFILPENHSRSLGGESKKATLTKTENVAQLKRLKQEEIADEALLYFYTPLLLNYFKDFENYFTVETIANDDFEMISGWDMEKKRPKEARYAYPAGTVFFIHFKGEESKQEFIEKYSDYKLGDSTKEGFGCFFIGNQTKKN